MEPKKVESILKCNEVSSCYGIILNGSDTKELIEVRQSKYK